MLRLAASIFATSILVLGSAAVALAAPPSDSPLFVYSNTVNCSGIGWSPAPAFFTRGSFTETADSDNDAVVGDTLQTSLFLRQVAGDVDFTQQASSATFTVAGTTDTVDTPATNVFGGGDFKLADAPNYVITDADAGTVINGRTDQFVFSPDGFAPSTCTTSAGDGIISVYVNEAPDLDDDSDDTEVGESVTVDVLDNDDVTNDSGTVGANPTLEQAQLTQDNVATANANQLTIDDDADNGECEVTADQDITYTPDSGFIGEDTCTYEVTDNDGDTSTAELTIDVAEPANVPPVAGDLDLETDYETELSIILGSDTQDEDGDDLTYSTGPVTGIGGTVVCDAPGDPNCTYTPPAGESGEATFEFTVSDGTDSDTGTVTITVADEDVNGDGTDDDDADGSDNLLPDTGAPSLLAPLVGLGVLSAGGLLLAFGRRRQAQHRA